MLPGLVISAISLAIVLYLADLEELVNALRLADYRLVLAGVLVSVVWLIVRGLAWRSLLFDRVPWKTVFLTLSQGYLLNNILPFRLGEIGRALLLGRKTGFGFWQILSSIVIERTLDLALAAGLLMCTIPFVVGAASAWQGAVISAIVVAGGMVLLYLMARNREWTEARFERLAGRWGLIKKLVGSRLPSFLAGLSVLTESGYFSKAVALMVLDWFIAIVQYYLILLAFFPEAQFLWAAFSLGVAALGIAAPSSPGAIGVLEVALVAALSLFTADLSTALAFALTVHVINYLLIGVLGAYALARDGETLTGLYHSARGLLNRSAPS
jgi:glycosyltransferase 2 family protein